MGSGMCLKDACNILLFMILVVSLIFAVISFFEVLQLGRTPISTFEQRGWLFCVAYPLAKVALPSLWFGLACYDVARKCKEGRADYYYLPQYLTELYSILATLFLMVTPPALVGSIAFCVHFGFFGDNGVIALEGAEFNQLLLAHSAIASTELLTYALLVELFPAYVLQSFRAV